MKRIIRSAGAVLLIAVLLLCSAACAKQTDTEKLWSTAVYTEDLSLGEGKFTVAVTIEAGEKSISLTVKTDKETLGAALYELGLVNDPAFFDTCNGIKADWNRDKAYWAFHVNGKAAQYGINDAKAGVDTGDAYKLVYTV